jgi:hypothetical protein
MLKFPVTVVLCFKYNIAPYCPFLFHSAPVNKPKWLVRQKQRHHPCLTTRHGIITKLMVVAMMFHTHFTRDEKGEFWLIDF